MLAIVISISYRLDFFVARLTFDFNSVGSAQSTDLLRRVDFNCAGSQDLLQLLGSHELHSFLLMEHSCFWSPILDNLLQASLIVEKMQIN